MTVTIKKVTTKKELTKFIRFNYELYKNNPYSVPDLYDDMLNTFNPERMLHLSSVKRIIFGLSGR